MRLPMRFYQLGRKFVFYHCLMVELLQQAKGSLTQLNRFGRVLDNLRLRLGGRLRPSVRR